MGGGIFCEENGARAFRWPPGESLSFWKKPRYNHASAACRALCPLSLTSIDCVTQGLLHGTANASAYGSIAESRNSPGWEHEQPSVGSADQALLLPCAGEVDTATLSAGEGPELTQGLGAVGSCWLSSLCVCLSFLTLEALM